MCYTRDLFTTRTYDWNGEDTFAGRRVFSFYAKRICVPRKWLCIIEEGILPGGLKTLLGGMFHERKFLLL